MSSNNNYQTLVIGSGPAGLTAGLYLARAGVKSLTISGYLPGGQAVFAGEVDNYPGFPDGITGFELTNKMKQQAEKFGAHYADEVVTAIDLPSRPYQIWTNLPADVNYLDLQSYHYDDWQQLGARVRAQNPEPTYTAESLIIATGSQARFLGLDNEKKWLGHGVAICATCDGYRYKDQEVAVVGGGDSALNDVLFLASLCKKVTLIHRGETWKSTHQHKIASLSNFHNIEYRWQSNVVELKGETMLEKIVVENARGEQEEIAVAALFIAIGRAPNIAVFANQLAISPTGHLAAPTHHPGIFIAGDVASPAHNQISVAAAGGAVAAMDCIEYNTSHGFTHE